jgi:hypothetical protein
VCKSWSPPLKEEYRLRVHDHLDLRRILGAGENGINKELQNSCSSQMVISMIKCGKMRGAQAIAHMRKLRNFQ